MAIRATSRPYLFALKSSSVKNAASGASTATPNSEWVKPRWTKPDCGSKKGSIKMSASGNSAPAITSGTALGPSRRCGKAQPIKAPAAL